MTARRVANCSNSIEYANKVNACVRSPFKFRNERWKRPTNITRHHAAICYQHLICKVPRRSCATTKTKNIESDFFNQNFGVVIHQLAQLFTKNFRALLHALNNTSLPLSKSVTSQRISTAASGSDPVNINGQASLLRASLYSCVSLIDIQVIQQSHIARFVAKTGIWRRVIAPIFAEV